ncbi:exonuclease SbcCD subunit D [Clostridium sp. MD294]|uniref:exonuclease SbcCD subunit D n=1 Tax=Clostridium sp. MD294 TaxID=97138 RepID=UPI0002CBA719|nr:exonuclease SbcCD subunit D [Clostridium sp. MD294]NDO46559.1 exonuclease SbcCD subunit D [Clostridium sp. MD294]USF29010.1 Nuclease SbcCD subunit D [Clostridium sp. MD294]
MKFIHLSDLHIGKKVNEFSMLEDQKYIFEKIISIIEQQNVNGVCIAGDIYDKSIPPKEAVQVFDDFLTKIAKKNIPVFVISGNHDAAERIAFGAELMKQSSVYFSPVFDGNVNEIILKDEYGEIAIYMLPFIKPATVRPFYSNVEINSYNDAVKIVIENMNINKNRRNILIAHQFVTGAEKSNSEDISVGEIDNVDADVFSDFDYVALGHIHKPQYVGRETIRYCGTPLKYSFSEVNHKKSVTIVTLKQKNNVSIEKIELIPQRDMCEIEGYYQEITSLCYYKNINVQNYMHIILKDEQDIIDAIAKLRSIYPNIMRLDYNNKRTQNNQTVPVTENIENKTPLQLLQQFYEAQNNCAMTEQQTVFSARIMEKIWEVEL